MNVAIHLKRQGKDPILVSKVGNDAMGEELLQFLRRSELDLHYIHRDEMLSTSKVLVHLDVNKNATYEICEPVAWDNITPGDDLDQLALKTGLIIFGTLASRDSTTRNTLFSFLEKSPAFRLLDINLRPPYDTREVVEPLLKAADMVKLNEEELERVAGWFGQKGDEFSQIEWLAGFFDCGTVCVTRGVNGAVLFVDNKFFGHPGYKVNTVDTVGAGDSFLAGLVSGLSDGSSPEKALDFACATGAYVASQKGAVPEYTLQDITSLMK
jgi:fructokinase